MLIPDFYTLQSYVITNEHITAQIRIHAFHPIFQGHFPGQPVTPGVCMLQICKELTEHVTRQRLRLNTCKNVKFTSPINPLTHPEVQVKLQIKSSEDSNYLVTGSVHYENIQAIKLSLIFTPEMYASPSS